MYLGDSRALMLETLEAESIGLVMTSPPFGLVRKKTYGNEDADEYLRWFRPFAQGMHQVLKPRGSAVIDIGRAWKPGMLARSLYHFELLIMLCREFGFYLCQEHFWWNPAKLPTPAERVNIRRVRVKDAVNTVWWISKTPWPKASNRRVLAPYSKAMEALLRHGYKAMLRPSGHSISQNFARRNDGAVPPNLIAAANTESNGRYQAYCKEQGITPHPARFTPSLPEYFIRMLTDKDDLVLDPFAGSCVTAEVAEALGRQWVTCELEEEYLRGARGRFETPPRLARLSLSRTPFIRPRRSQRRMKAIRSRPMAEGNAPPQACASPEFSNPLANRQRSRSPLAFASSLLVHERRPGSTRRRYGFAMIVSASHMTRRNHVRISRFVPRCQPKRSLKSSLSNPPLTISRTSCS
jgi:site-specific DNA-methyltransferase (cytosine-N4-specific)